MSATGPAAQLSRNRAAHLVGRIARNRRSLSLADQALISATNMCTSVILGRTCAKSQLGLYASGISLVLLVTAIQTALIAVPFTISSPRFAKDDRALYKGSTILQQISLVCLAMLAFLCAGWFGHGDGALRSVLLTLSIVTGLICFRDLARRISYAELDFAFAVVVDGVLAIGQLLAVSLLAWSHRLSAGRALLSVGLASAAASALWLAVNRREISFSIAHAAAGFRVNWALGRWTLMSCVLWSLCIDQYPWLIAMLRAPSEAALWAAAYGAMAFLNPFVLALNNDAAPRVSNHFAAHFATNGAAGFSRSVFRCAAIAGAITLPVLCAILLFGPQLVRLMYGAGYTGAGTAVRLLAVGLWFYAIGLSFPYGLLALQRPEVDFRINVICLVSFLLAGIWLIQKYGATGAACSFLLVQSVALTSRVLAFRSAIRTAAGRAAAARLQGVVA